jgi:hypothetical protein
MSVDFRLMFIYHVSMMLLFVAGGSGISLRHEIFATILLVAVLVAVSVRNRKKKGWHWQGIGATNVLFAIGSAILIAFFLFAATPLFPPSNPQSLPWYLAGAGIGIFGILHSLRIVYAAEADFLANCGSFDPYRQGAPPIPQRFNSPGEAPWKKATRTVYGIVFMLVWVSSVLSFYKLGVSFKGGSAVPAQTQTEPLTDHGRTVYITSAEKQQLDILQMISMTGIPVMVVGGLCLHFIAGVKLYGNTSSLAEYLRQRKSSSGQSPGK